MECLVSVHLGCIDPVAGTVLVAAEFAGNGVEHSPALLLLRGFVHRIENNADGIQVEYLFKGDILGLHLPPYGIGALEPLDDAGVDAAFQQHLVHLAHKTLDGRPLCLHYVVQLGVDTAVLQRLVVAHPYILHLALDVVQAKPVCQRDKDEHGFAQNLFALVLRHKADGADVVQAVGQLYEHYAGVIVEGEQDPLEILRLHALCGGDLLEVVVVEGALDFGEAVNKARYLAAEHLTDVVGGIFGVLHHIVEKGGADGLASEAYLLDHYPGHGNGVEYVGLPAAPADIAVGFIGKFKRLEHQVVLILVGTALEAYQTEFLKLAPDKQFI